ncbi:AtpZ/AtpI family protein [Aquamicrobium lusatiense]|uniref:AtpZ/AtpI family protein n=1 Tax=Aquamicrobium lusatiense TaxID=89772 RepID=UPI00245724A5|nr:AtpZ/AtpI family protein [Aquamicrobium lusatiense]MDH4992568.1 AtpZ/AtpI family protein [Aquamicrobium lusatiense]
MAGNNGPDGTGETGPRNDRKGDIRDDELERRRRELGASLAARHPKAIEGEDNAQAGGSTGYGQAFKLSSEFIAGVVVGIAIGWMVDHLAGTSPWGLIVFLLVGFAAGVLNVLRSAGMVAGFGQTKSGAGPKDLK